MLNSQRSPRSTPFSEKPMRTVEWDTSKNNVRMIDQRMLPGEFRVVELNTSREVATAIREMVVRGAPAIGASAAFGFALAAYHSQARNLGEFRSEMQETSEVLCAARPTAVNLSWAITRLLKLVNQYSGTVEGLKTAVIQEALRIADEDVEINKQMARFGAELISDGDNIIHHCNTGALATVDWGTALGVIRMAHEEGKRIHVLVDETRPRLQGSRLTAWELENYGIPYDIISDNAAGYFLSTGRVQKVFFGADRVAFNGDVANKIGTYMLALAATDNKVPVYAVVPTSTIDPALASGDLIPIEERDPGEVLNLEINHSQVSPPGSTARNPAFDITPSRLISAIVTEKGIVYPPFKTNLMKVCSGGSN